MALLPQHENHLKSAAISPEVIAGRGYFTANRDNTGDTERSLRSLRIPSWAYKNRQQHDGIVIPMYGASGNLISHQYRPDTPPRRNGKPVKYISPQGGASRLDVHPHNRDRILDLSVPLWITEGIKKGDALTSCGACVVTLTGVFNWRSRLATLGDWEDIPLKGREIVVCFDADARTNLNVARAMVRLGRWLKSRGARKVLYLIVPDSVAGVAVKGADDYLAAGGTLHGLQDAATTAEPDTNRADGTFSDAYMAETVADEVMTGRFRWSKGLGWIRWDGKRWARCADEAVIEAVRVYATERFQEVLAGMRDGTGQAANTNALDGWRSVLGRGRLNAIVSLARGITEFDVAELDADPDLLNCPNGVIDLRTGELHEHDPDLLITKMTAVDYDADATDPDWDLARTALPDDVSDYMRVRLGQAITGHTPPDDVMPILQGGGENGKSTWVDAASAAVGDYFVLISDRVILASPDAHPTELMDLRGARLAMIEETPEARRLSVSRLKKTVGTSKITARHIRQDDVTFTATHSLFVTSNYRPLIEETDHGTWRRLQLIRFPYTFVKVQAGEPRELGPHERIGDPTLRQRIARNSASRRAVLRWLVDGAREFYKNGETMPPPPATVAEDTREWRAETDVILGYWSMRLAADPAAHALSRDLADDFNDWHTSNGHRPWSEKLFVERFGSHSETAGARVEKKVVRRTMAGLSRPDSVWTDFNRKPVPGQYNAFLGIRFQTASDQG